MRIIFMGTPSIAVPTLQRLHRDGHDLAAVITQPDRPAGRGHHVQPPPIKAAAQALGLPVWQPTKIKTPEFQAQIEDLKAEVGVVVAYGRILPPPILAAPRQGCLNVHFSLLPKYRGAAPVNWAIAHDEAVTGITVMYMDAGLDTGDIALQTECWIGRDETAPELGERLSHLGADLLSEALRQLAAGTLPRRPQDATQATYAPLLKREDGWIDWGLPATAVAARVRAFQPFPGVHSHLAGRRVTLWRARAQPERAPHGKPPGTILGIEADGLLVACGAETHLVVQELQLEGRARVSARDFANGLRLQPGACFISATPASLSADSE
ncbi:MAG: methionyl-tRNA formyltransferase [Chloracidobacterium sp.]|uniref:Methionyl-tRNA formyltransferase n=1 Tax=Chloracidobacterium validum TaxID=2821543 RepID=A0ABX8B6P9_9BACT|nr:methionyl-tRNA formyltransferase [Chloracidobacterium validum]QUW02311.1 methionyl-tRNA formyltransferase [Chloracidobacterium validum]